MFTLIGSIMDHLRQSVCVLTERALTSKTKKTYKKPELL